MYRISRDSSSSSCFLSGVGITEAVAVFPAAIAIANELLSAVLAGKSIKSLLLYLVLVAVPVGHTALIIAVPFFFASRLLLHGSAAMLTQHQVRFARMPLQIGFHSIGGDPGLRRDPLISHTQPSQGINIIDFPIGHI